MRRSAAIFMMMLLCVGIWSIPKDRTANPDGDEIDETIRKFFRASLEGDMATIDQITSEIPDHYFQKWNECESIPTPEPAMSPESGVGRLIITKNGVTESDRSYASAALRNTIGKIKEQNLDSLVILDRRISSDHALVKVDYGDRERNRPRVGFFLLDRKFGKWRIFDITTGHSLESTNKHFASEGCR